MKNYQLFNLKSFTDSTEIEIKPITIVIGKNSSGKSSLIRFPIVLKQTILENIGPLLLFGKLIDYGNYEDIIYNHNEESNFSFKLTYSEKTVNVFLKRYNLRSNYIFENDVSIFIEIGKSSGKSINWSDMEIKKFEISTADKVIFKSKLKKDDLYACLIFDKESNLNLTFNTLMPEIEYEEMIRNRQKNDEEFVSELSKVRQIFRVLEMVIHESMNRVNYLGPFRKTPERNFRYQQANMLNLGTDGEYTFEILASYYKRNDKDFFFKLNNWLSKHLRINLKVEDLNGGMYRILITDLDTGVTNNIRDVGFGLSQVLPVIVQVFINNKIKTKANPNTRTSFLNNLFSKINIIEQPELHLHPAAQALLADLFISGTELDKTNHYIIETHSEHLILRLRRRILEKKISPDNVAIYFLDKNSEDTASGSKVNKLSITNEGFIENFPSDFFDQDYKEIMEINKIRFNNSSGDNSEW